MPNVFAYLKMSFPTPEPSASGRSVAPRDRIAISLSPRVIQSIAFRMNSWLPGNIDRNVAFASCELPTTST